MKRIIFALFTVFFVFSSFCQDVFRKINNTTWNLNNQIEYYKSSSSIDEAPTSYYYEQDGVWRLTNVVSSLGWVNVSGWIKSISNDTNPIVFVEIYDVELKRRIPKYAIALYPKVKVSYNGDKIKCLVYYSCPSLPPTIEKDGNYYTVVQYGIPKPESEQSFLQQIKLQLPSKTVSTENVSSPDEDKTPIVNGNISSTFKNHDVEQWINNGNPVPNTFKSFTFKLVTYQPKLLAKFNGFHVWYRQPGRTQQPISVCEPNESGKGGAFLGVDTDLQLNITHTLTLIQCGNMKYIILDGTIQSSTSGGPNIY